MKSLAEVEKIRRRLQWTQKELAARANVSQSLIAKVEAGRIDPSFGNGVKILEALQQEEEKNEVKARQIMNRKVVFCNGHDDVKEVIKIMKSRGISQMPVMVQGKVVGLISEGLILQEVTEHPEQIARLKAAEMMDDAPPIISPSAGWRIISELLRDYPLLLVAEKGEVQGVISKTDLLGRVGKD